MSDDLDAARGILFGALIGFAFWAFSAVVILTAREYGMAEVRQDQARQQYPEIPKCDKPTWERITEGCNHEKQNQ